MALGGDGGGGGAELDEFLAMEELVSDPEVSRAWAGSGRDRPTGGGKEPKPGPRPSSRENVPRPAANQGAPTYDPARAAAELAMRQPLFN